jgi:hypothetical protein
MSVSCQAKFREKRCEVAALRPTLAQVQLMLTHAQWTRCHVSQLQMLLWDLEFGKVIVTR